MVLVDSARRPVGVGIEQRVQEGRGTTHATGWGEDFSIVPSVFSLPITIEGVVSSGVAIILLFAIIS
jgi:hypothetical protein